MSRWFKIEGKNKKNMVMVIEMKIGFGGLIKKNIITWIGYLLGFGVGLRGCSQKPESQNCQTDGANWGHGPQLAHLGHQPFKLAVIGK